jgi:hypothetical protein
MTIPPPVIGIKEDASPLRAALGQAPRPARQRLPRARRAAMRSNPLPVGRSRPLSDPFLYAIAPRRSSYLNHPAAA